MPRGVQATTGAPLVTDAALSLEVPPGPAGPMVDVRGARGHFGRWLARRLALGVVILFAVSVLVFVATQALPSRPGPGDPRARSATPASLAALNAKLGLDKPLITSTPTGSAGCCTATSACRWPAASRSARSSRTGSRTRSLLVLLVGPDRDAALVPDRHAHRRAPRGRSTGLQLLLASCSRRCPTS